MATTYSYIYTLQTFVNWSQLLSNADIASPYAGNAYFDLSTTPTLIQMTGESNSLTPIASTFTVQEGCSITYVLKFYMVATTGSTNTYYWLSNDHVSNIKINFSEYKGKLQNTTPAVQFQYNNSPAFTVGNPGEGSAWWFSVIATQSGFNLGPSAFTVNADIVADIGNTYGGNTDTSTHNNPSLAGYNPNIKISKSSPIPPTPSALVDKLNTAAATLSSNPGTTALIYSQCDSLWFGLAIGPTEFNAVTGKNMYTYTMYSASPNDTNIKIVKGPITETPPLTGLPDVSQLSKDRALLRNKVLGDCSGVLTGKSALAGGTGGGGGNTGNQTPIITTPPSVNSQWNPPPYLGSRAASFSEVMSQQYLTSTGAGSNSVERGIGADVSAILSTMSSANQGKIFQDSYSAAALNSYQSNLSLKGTSGSKQWGFRFMYNPTSFSYNTSSNNSVDFTNGSNDPSALLVGNSQVTFELYLNRILDMSYIQGETMKGNRDFTKGYGRDLTDDELYGILYRGTEYDLEFLYRVLNGSPLSGSALLSDDYKSVGGVTSDFGYTTAVPCWLWLHDNLRYFGSIASLQVNHVMFDLRMVPLLSVVSITYSRYPSLNSSNSALSETSISTTAANNANGLTTGTGTTG